MFKHFCLLITVHLPFASANKQAFYLNAFVFALTTAFIMVAVWNRADHYIFILWFFLSFFFSSPNLSGRRLDVYSTSTHGVDLVRIKNAALKRAARGSLEMQDPKNRQKVVIWAP